MCLIFACTCASNVKILTDFQLFTLESKNSSTFAPRLIETDISMMYGFGNMLSFSLGETA